MNHYLKTGVIAFALTLGSIFSVSADELDRLETELKSEEVAKTEPAFVVSANVGIASEYVWRGVTQSNEDPAIQGGFDISHSSGLYIGTWASSLEFNSAKTDAASTEIDVYAGYRGQGFGLSYDIGYLHYLYAEQNEDSGSGDYNFGEIYGSVSKSFGGLPLSPTLQAGISISPDFYGETGLGVYSYKSASLVLPAGITGNVVAGYQDIEDGKNYFHYSVGASKTIGKLTGAVSWNDVTTDGVCSSGNDCEAFVFSLSTSF